MVIKMLRLWQKILFGKLNFNPTIGGFKFNPLWSSKLITRYTFNNDSFQTINNKPTAWNSWWKIFKYDFKGEIMFTRNKSVLK